MNYLDNAPTYVYADGAAPDPRLQGMEWDEDSDSED